MLVTALRRVSTCECGAETSCYGCLRSYSNQRDHDELSRGAAEQILRRLLDNVGDIDPTYSQPVEAVEAPAAIPVDWADTYAAATDAERALLVILADAGAARPELGAESAGGIPIPVSWPDRLLTADLGLAEEAKRDLKAEGWTVMSPGPQLSKAARMP